MTSMKIVVGAAMAALLAVNVFGAVALFNGISTFERVGNVAERFTDGGDRQAGQSEYRGGDFDDDDSNGGDFDGGDFDGGEIGRDFQAPSFIGGPPSPGFFEGKGKGKGKGGEGAREMAHAVENANLGIRDAEDIALGEIPGDIVEAKLKGKDGFPHYEIEVLDGDGQLHEVLVEAREGGVMGRKFEGPEDSHEMAHLFDQASMSRDEAESVAADAFPGQVVENKLDDENGFAVWEIETFDENDGLLHEAKVNAQNGDIPAYETKGSF